ncbi:MAG: glycosyltransferase family 39 protein [Candidatus Humimicrobiaceae bacterium]
MLIFFITSTTGPGMSPDSVAYVAAARNILDGNGMAVLFNSDGTIPLNLWQPVHLNEAIHVFKWPPLYPFMLSLVGISGLDIIEGARWLSSALFGLNIFMIGFIIIKTTRSIFLSLSASLIFLFSKEIIYIHHTIWTEPLFILLGFFGLFFLINFIDTKKLSFLFLSALFIGLSFLTRYSGAVLVITSVIALLFFKKEKINKKILHASIFVLLSCLPVVIWFARLQFLKSGISVRRLGFNPIRTDELRLFIENISKWFMPGSAPFILRLIFTGLVCILILAGFIMLIKRIKDKSQDTKQKTADKISILFLVFIFLYLGFNFLTRLTAGANMDFWDNRHLAPVLSAVIIVVILIFYSILKQTEKNDIIRGTSKTLVYSILAVFIIFYISYFFYGNNMYTYKILRSGTGYSTFTWRTSETIEGLKKLPESILIYTNEPIAVYILSNRPSKMVPSKTDLQTQKKNDSYLREVKEMEEQLKKENGIIVIFDNGLGFLAKEEDLKYDLNLIPFEFFDDGFFYKIH